MHHRPGIQVNSSDAKNVSLSGKSETRARNSPPDFPTRPRPRDASRSSPGPRRTIPRPECPTGRALPRALCRRRQDIAAAARAVHRPSPPAPGRHDAADDRHLPHRVRARLRASSTVIGVLAGVPSLVNVSQPYLSWRIERAGHWRRSTLEGALLSRTVLLVAAMGPLVAGPGVGAWILRRGHGGFCVRRDRVRDGVPDVDGRARAGRVPG